MKYKSKWKKEEPYKLSITSHKRLGTCCTFLIMVVMELLNFMDVTVAEGHRGADDQNKYLLDGKTTLPWPGSKHNCYPSSAVDIYPYYNGKMITADRANFCYMGGLFIGIARKIQLQHEKYANLKIRWGGDWDRDGIAIHDQEFNDLCHFEVVE